MEFREFGERATVEEDDVVGDSVGWVENVAAGAASDNDDVDNVGIATVVVFSVVFV